MSERTETRLLSKRTPKSLERAAEDLESAAARHGLRVSAIHAPDSPVGGVRLYEICHSEAARELLREDPDLAVLIPCRVLLREEAGVTVLVALRPGTLLREREECRELADTLDELLARAVGEASR